MKRPGLLYGRILRSPHPHARITSIDLAPALAMKGVKAAVTIAKPGGKVMYVGDEVAAVAAATEDQARDAARAIKVEYEVLPFLAVDRAGAAAGGAAGVRGRQREGRRRPRKKATSRPGFAAAAHVVEQTYNTQVQTHVSLETHGCVCEWEGEKLTAWVSTQAVHGTREGFATSLGIPQANVRVITEHMGGGFGSKFGPDVQGIACARLAKDAKAPVQLMLDRREEHLAAGNRPSAYAKIKAGVSADGMLTAFDAESWGTGGAGASSGFPLPYIYTFPNRRRVHKDVYINAGPAARDARAGPSAGLLHHRDVDGRARGPRQDGPDRVPHPEPAAAGAQRDVARVLQGRRLEVRLGQAPRDRRSDAGPDQARHGLRRQPVGRRRSRHAGAVRDPARRRRRRALRHAGPRRRHADADCRHRGRDARPAGEGHQGRTRRQQLPVQRRQRRFDDGAGGVAGDPRDGEQGAAGAGDARGAGHRRRGQPRSPRAAAASTPRARPARGCRGPTRASGCRRRRCRSTPGWEPGLSASGSSGVQFAEVSVDIETGVAKVERILCVQDCGLIVNQLTAESQCIGGMIMGVGYALYEDRILDRNTAMQVNPNMEWYLVPGMSDIPKIDIMLMNQPERGVIGIGEPPTISTAAAIANAVANAIGVRVRSIPLTPQKVLTALAGRTRRRHAVKPFAYVKAANEQQALAALGRERGKVMPLAGGMDLVSLLKDRIATPDRLVNVKGLDATITATPDGGLRIGAAVRLVDLQAHATVTSQYAALDGSGCRSRHAADPQPRDGRRQPDAAAALLVLPQRGVPVPEEGRRAVLLGGRREPVPRDPRRRPVPHRASVEPGRAARGLRREAAHRRTTRREGSAGRGVLRAAGTQSLWRDGAAAR